MSRSVVINKLNKLDNLLQKAQGEPTQEKDLVGGYRKAKPSKSKRALGYGLVESPAPLGAAYVGVGRGKLGGASANIYGGAGARYGIEAETKPLREALKRMSRQVPLSVDEKIQLVMEEASKGKVSRDGAQYIIEKIQRGAQLYAQYGQKALQARQAKRYGTAPLAAGGRHLRGLQY